VTLYLRPGRPRSVLVFCGDVRLAGRGLQVEIIKDSGLHGKDSGVHGQTWVNVRSRSTATAAAKKNSKTPKHGSRPRARSATGIYFAPAGRTQMKSNTTDDSIPAVAHHEAGHALLHRLVRGPFQDNAILSLRAFHTGSAAGTCRNGALFVGAACGDGYCLHEVWEDLAGPIAEWRFRHKAKLTSDALFPWLLSLSADSLNKCSQNQVNCDDLTSAPGFMGVKARRGQWAWSLQPEIQGDFGMFCFAATLRTTPPRPRQ
jgi:hypothetical protein